jgi:tetratricopeptide (TPR) repeat protein
VVTLALFLLVAGSGGAIAVQRQSAPWLTLRGQRALEVQDLLTAESLLRQAVTRDPNSAEAYFYLGVTFSAQEEMAEAAEAYQNALRLEPNLAEAHWNLALAYVALERPADAISEFEAFLTLRPDSPNTHEAHAFIAELRESLP